MEDQQLNEDNLSQSQEPALAEQSAMERKLGTIGWALFFIWIGISFLANFDIGIGLLGIGVITLGVQIARKRADLKFEGFWLVIGLLFVLGGFWDLFETDISLVPILLIIAGLVLIASVAKRKR